MIEKFFSPNSLCVVGASSKPNSIGYELLKTIKYYGFKNDVTVVNPNAETILDYKCYSSVSAVPGIIDLAFVVVPKQFVEESIDLLLEKNVKAIVLITAGYRETGKEGALAEEKLVAKVRAKGARLVGPNCMGLINSFSDVRLNATFVAESPRESNTAFLSQSGALGAAVLNSLRETGFSFGHFLSVGNKSDINENDLLEYWLKDKKIRAIAMYLESFADGQKFLELVKEGNKKPVIVVKAGRGEAGTRAAASHTGALGTPDSVVDAVCRQSGVIRANTIDEMFYTLQAFEQYPMPEGKRVAILTNAGGPSILAVDALESRGLTLPQLSESTKEKLKNIVHPEGSITNPVDLLPGGTAEQFSQCAELLAADENVDVVISIFVEPVMVKALPVVLAIDSVLSDKPIYQVVMPLPEFWNEYKSASPKHLVLFRKPEDPAAVIANLLHYRKSFSRADTIQPNLQATLISEKSGWASYKQIKQLFDEYHLPMVESTMLNGYEFAELAETFNYPLVLKGMADNVSHKSELDLVQVNIGSPQELVQCAIEMEDRAKKNQLRLKSYLVQQMEIAKFEVLIGGFRDSSFGPMVMFGAGGKYVEFLNDIEIRSAYLTESDIDDMFERTIIGKILQGVRGEQAADIESLKEIIRNVARMMIDHSQIQEVDLNPVMVSYHKGPACVDARIKLG